MQSQRQRYRCTQCGHRYQLTRYQPKHHQAALSEQYVWGKQTLTQLAQAQNRSLPWVKQQLDEHRERSQLAKIDLGPASVRRHTWATMNPHSTPQPVVLVIDAFYYRRGDGTMLFRASNLSRNLLWFPTQSETIAEYAMGVAYVESLGFTVLAIVCDGRRGVREAFAPRYPVQMCQFHQLQIVHKHLTRHPQLEAAIELRRIALTLSYTTETVFATQLEQWYERWAEFLKQRTIHPNGKRWSYTHKRVRSAYRSLHTNLPYLFTHQRYPDRNIPNTTNSLDGSITHIRKMLNLHRGLSNFRKDYLTDELLRGETPQNFH